MLAAKFLGHFSPHGSYWAALSLISDGEAEEVVEKYIAHAEKWSHQHVILRPRVLHLRAEIASRTNTFEADSLCCINS
jgi:hypothetical protein